MIQIKNNRDQVFTKLRNQGIGVNVHYVPVHLHPYYRRNLGTKVGMCPVSEKAYSQLISLPIFSTLEDYDVSIVIDSVLNSEIF